MPRDKHVRAVGFAVIVAVGLWLNVFFTAPRNLEFTFLDVGDGLCTVMRTPSGRTLIMDCGTCSWRNNNSAIGKKLVAPFLQRSGLDTIDVAVLSHPHADHYSGFAGLFKLKPAKLVIGCGARSKNPDYKIFSNSVKASHARYRIAKRGQVIDMGDGVKARILSPDPKTYYDDLNDRSIVLRVTYKRVAVLLTADAGDQAEQEMLKSGQNVRAQVLQVGHHGSRRATSSPWLAAVRPHIAVISCARRSRYHFPSRTVTSRLRGFGARTYTTGQCGAVTVTTDGETIRVNSVREQ